MSRSSFLTGLVISVLAHALLFLPGGARPNAAEHEDSASSPDEPIMIDPSSLIAAADDVKALPPPRRDPLPEPESDPVEPEPRPTFERVLDPESIRALAEDNGNRRQDERDARLPTMQILWSGPEQVRRVAAALGVRIVAIGSEQRMLGEIPARGVTRLVEFDEDLARFSNRVRTLPRGFFGLAVEHNASEPVEAYWLLVPAGVDRTLAAVQREAIDHFGADPDRVKRMEARFEGVGAAPPRLVVTDIHTR